MKSKNIITVTKPSLPALEEFEAYLESIWESGWITNNGQYHRQLEKELSTFLGVKHISLCANGTLALMLALKALDIKGEIITTPFSFVATSHSILWMNCTPVFVDIDPDTYNLDPEKIQDAITERTSAIMPVHVYGNPCDHDKIEKIAHEHGLKIIYDAAHAFNVKKDGNSILNWGDLSVLSFHATKVFNTFEGGAIVCHDEEMKNKIDKLKNFGFQNETTIVDTGINAKMNEVQAAMGLLQLKSINEEIEKRKYNANLYSQMLGDKDNGIKILKFGTDVESNYAYYPIIIDGDKLGKDRDELYDLLKENNIYSRKYFYPLISSFSMYKELESSSERNLPIANDIAKKVLCLPIYSDLEDEDIKNIVNIIMNK